LLSLLVAKASSEKNTENQFIDFHLLTTKKEKPRFILLCQQP